MRIYIIPAWYPQNENDIFACFFREQAHALADRGHEVTVIHIQPLSFTHIARTHFHEKRVWQDGNVRTVFHNIVIPVPGKFSSVQDKYISNQYYKIIKSQIEEDKIEGKNPPDLIHSHVSHSCAYYCINAAKKLSLPLVVTEHYSGLLLGTASDKDYERVKQTMLESDAFIFVGTNFKRVLCEKFNVYENMYFVPNMIKNLGNHVSEKSHDKFKFLTACTLKKIKSVDLVIKAFHDAFPKENSVELVIAGDGDERSYLEDLVSQLDENGRITFIGKYSRDNRDDIFSSCDAFVLADKVETFGIVYIEAMMCGLPCIGTKGQGADDIIDDSCGYRIEFTDHDALVSAMRSIYNEYEKYDKQAIRERCLNLFSEDTVCSQIEQIYKKVVEEKKK